MNINALHYLAYNTYKYRQLIVPLAIAFTSIIGSNNRAQALSFNFTFSEDSSSEVRSVFLNAGDTWSAQFTDDVTVNIFVDYGTLPDKVLAGTRPGMTRVTYSDFLTKLNQDKSSPDVSKYVSSDYNDALALSNLQNGTNFQYLRNADKTNGNSNGESSKVAYADTVWLTRANAKALGIINQNNGNYKDFDASIRISNTTSWHYDPNTAAGKNEYDLLTVATHEIGHTLGFVSGLDAFELLAISGNSTGNSTAPYSNYVTPMDLLRYSNQSKKLGIPDWTTQGQSYFSVDGGEHNLGDFAGGVSVDGSQASHWKNNDAWGIMNPVLKTGSDLEMSDIDETLLDAIGWDRGTQLSKNMVAVMQGINWNTSNPDLSKVENLLKNNLSTELGKLASERDAIQNTDSKVWSDLGKQADGIFQTQQQKIMETLNKIRDQKSNPDKRLGEALKGVSDLQQALADLNKVYTDKLQAPMAQQINDWLKLSPGELQIKLKNATPMQLKILAQQVKSAESGKQKGLKKNLKDALRLLYQNLIMQGLLSGNANNQISDSELNTALEKLLDSAAPDMGFGWSFSWNFWQTRDTSSSFDKTGEFTLHHTADEEAGFESEIASVPEPASTSGILGLGLFGIGGLLKRRGKKV